MDWERAKISTEIVGIKARARVVLAVQFIGLLLIFLGAYNFFGHPLTEELLFAGYRDLLAAVGLEEYILAGMAEVLLMAVGAALAWFV